MHNREFYALQGQVEELQARLDSLEANSRNAASSGQPFVGPSSSSEDSRALARPETLSEVYAYIEDRLEVISDHYISTMSQTGYDKIRNEILQHLTQLDQGPVAQKPATEITLLDERGRPHV